VRGHEWLEDLWAENVPEELAGLDATLMALGFFASRQMAEDCLPETSDGESSLETATVAMHEALPGAVAFYAALGRSIAESVTKHDAEEAVPAHHREVGRNDPCPCGSGKKYKKCCGATVH